MALQFAYWAPNVSGGLVVSELPQKTGWNYEDNKRYAQLAEKIGFDYVLLQTRFLSSYGAENQLEAATLASALAASTKSLNIITAVLPGLWQPAVFAKMMASIDHISSGRASVNVVSGWLKDEFLSYGEPWLDHDARYKRSEEFIEVLKLLWNDKSANYNGQFYKLENATLEPKPINPITVFQGGASRAAKEMGGRVSDVFFMNGNTLEGFKEIIEDVKKLRQENGQQPIKFGVNGFAIVRETEEEAQQVLRDIVLNANTEAVKGFQKSVEQAGKASPEGKGMWSDATLEDLVQYNEGFKTGLIGTPDQVAKRIIELKEIGVDIVLTGFLHYEEDLKDFGEKVIPLVREKEAALNSVTV
ncbi:dimethylsulfone monooxygenase SfnG [Rummeliibacillus pycnus]|uniref:dimethylsulfone monooxygenase SfnG n=1 Tax=Rummeliibacillus pycnus TaxID=101070 RepID=UPI003D2747CF